MSCVYILERVCISLSIYICVYMYIHKQMIYIYIYICCIYYGCSPTTAACRLSRAESDPHTEATYIGENGFSTNES